MKKIVRNSRNGNCAHTPFNKRGGLLGFVRFLITDFEYGIYKVGFAECKKCGKLIELPAQYYSIPVRVLYFLISAFTIWGVLTAAFWGGIYQAVGMFTTILFVIVCFALVMLVFDRLASAVIIYFCEWTFVDILPSDEMVFFFQKEEQVKSDRNRKLESIGLGVAATACIMERSLRIVIALAVGIAIGFFLRWCISKIKK